MAKDMTAGNPTKLILSFVIPVFIGNLFQNFYNIVDTMIVGRFVGVNALAAVGSTSSVMFCVQGLAIGMTTGFGVLISQAFGEKDERRLRHYVAMSGYLSVIISAAVTALLLVYIGKVLEIMNTPKLIFGDANRYLLIVFGGFVATVAYNMLSAILRAIGDSKTPLYFLILSSVLNVVLDIVFVVPIQMGVAGVAWATVIAQSVSAVLCLIYMLKKYPQIVRISKEEGKYSGKSAGKLLGMGIPMALQFSITALGTMIVQSTLNLLGELPIAAYAAAQKIQSLMCQPYIAMGTAMATYVGQNAGAGRPDRIREGMRKAVILTLIFAAVGIVCALSVSGYGALLFVDASETEVIRLTRRYFQIAVWFYPFLGLIFVYRNALQGLGFGLDAMAGGIFELGARAILILVIGTSFGYDGVCACDPAAWIAALVPLIPMYYFRIRRTKLA